MKRPGPAIDVLTRRLAECPAELVGSADVEPEVGVAAAVNDVLVGLGGDALTAAEAAAVAGIGDPAHRRLLLVGAWLLADPALAAAGVSAPAASRWLTLGLARLAPVLSAARCVSDPDRREELARGCLAALELVPAGETEGAAGQRLQALDSVQRSSVVAAMRERARRARELAEKMAAEEARQAAARSGSEW